MGKHEIEQHQTVVCCSLPHPALGLLYTAHDQERQGPGRWEGAVNVSRVLKVVKDEAAGCASAR